MKTQIQKIIDLQQHIKKVLSLSDGEFNRKFPVFTELYLQAELDDLRNEVRLRAYKAKKKNHGQVR